MDTGRLKVLVGCILVLCIGVFFRIWLLDSMPPGLYHDEAIDATSDGWVILVRGDISNRVRVHLRINKRVAEG